MVGYREEVKIICKVTSKDELTNVHFDWHQRRRVGDDFVDGEKVMLEPKSQGVTLIPNKTATTKWARNGNYFGLVYEVSVYITVLSYVIMTGTKMRQSVRFSLCLQIQLLCWTKYNCNVHHLQIPFFMYLQRKQKHLALIYYHILIMLGPNFKKKRPSNLKCLKL